LEENNKNSEHVMKKQSNYSCDVLIIGGGSTGLRAAIEAHDAAANVLIISKSKRGDPQTTLEGKEKEKVKIEAPKIRLSVRVLK
jgi:thioredoxin reductase